MAGKRGRRLVGVDDPRLRRDGSRPDEAELRRRSENLSRGVDYLAGSSIEELWASIVMPSDLLLGDRGARMMVADLLVRALTAGDVDLDATRLALRAVEVAGARTPAEDRFVPPVGWDADARVLLVALLIGRAHVLGEEDDDGGPATS